MMILLYHGCSVCFFHQYYLVSIVSIEINQWFFISFVKMIGQIFGDFVIKWRVEMFVKLVSKKEDKNENEIISHKMKRLSGNQWQGVLHCELKIWFKRKRKKKLRKFAREFSKLQSFPSLFQKGKSVKCKAMLETNYRIKVEHLPQLSWQHCFHTPRHYSLPGESWKKKYAENFVFSMYV